MSSCPVHDSPSKNYYHIEGVFTIANYQNMHTEGILPKGPYQPCVSMVGRALLAGYDRYTVDIYMTGVCLVRTNMHSVIADRFSTTQ